MGRLNWVRNIVAFALVVGLLAPAPASGSSIPSRADIGTAAYIVYLRDTADLRPYAAIPDRAERRRAIVEALQQTAEASQRGLLASLERARLAGDVASYRPFWVTNAVAVRSSASVLTAVAARPEVDRVIADHEVRLVPAVDGDEDDADPEWGVERVNAPEAWSRGVDGTGVVVASIDTGVDHRHRALRDTYRGTEGGGHDHNWFDAVNGRPVPYDDHGHGTHVTGTMAGSDGFGPEAPDIGVAPRARWIAAKGLSGSGSGSRSGLLAAAEFIAAPSRADGTDPRPELAPDVVNNSWGSRPGCDRWFDETLSTWRALDILPVFSNGNSTIGPGSPGDSPLAFSVGATTQSDGLASFSSRGPTCDLRTKPDISAPGQGVRSSLPDDRYGSWSGTSMAAPHVAGAAALVLQASRGELGVDEVEDGPAPDSPRPRPPGNRFRVRLRTAPGRCRRRAGCPGRAAHRPGHRSRRRTRPGPGRRR